MKSLLTGDTPFEKAERARAKASLMMVTITAIKELVHQLDECTQTIEQWGETAMLHSEGKATKEELETDLMLATQALKDQKVFEAALVQICQTAGEDLGLEA